MSKNLIRLIIPEKTEAWYKQRLETIGASEVGCVMGLSQYKLAASLFLEKAYLTEVDFHGNKHTYFGTKMESLIADVWEYNDPLEPESYIENSKNGVKVRKCRQFNGILINKKFPWLSASLDRVICKGGFKLTDGSILENWAPLEIKTIDKYAMAMWASGVPPIYILQCMQQMLISETDYCEIALLDSGKDFHVYPIEFRDAIGNAILSETKLFWDNVIKAREYKSMIDAAQHSFNKKAEDELWAEVDKLVPRAKDGQEELYKDYLAKRYNKMDAIRILGDNELLDTTKRIVILKNVKKDIEAREQKEINSIKAFMKNSEILYWEGTDEKVTWRENKNGTRFFKMDVDADLEKSSILAETLINNL